MTAAAHEKEPMAEWLASLIGFFILLLIFKTFFIPLFVIPTGSMAPTLAGAHAFHTCANCGYTFTVGMHPVGAEPVIDLRCPNCRYEQTVREARQLGTYAPSFGDRITVLGWPYDVRRGRIGPARWDVVVFRNPEAPQMNFIKRLIALPGETVELIDGDIYIDGVVAAKPPAVQETLWLPFYNHDYPAREPVGDNGRYWPRWTPIEGDGWTKLDERVLSVNAAEARSVVQFTNQLRDGDVLSEAEITDLYGYNAPHSGESFESVTDTRLAGVIHDLTGPGYVELGVTKYDAAFAVRLHGDGRLVLMHGSLDRFDDAPVAEVDGVALTAPVQLSLGVADRNVWVRLNGETVEALQCTADRTPLSVEALRQRDQARRKPGPRLTLAAERATARFAHLRIDRDIHYKRGNPPHEALRAVDTPFELGSDEFFVLGDNSPSSADGRLWRRHGSYMLSDRYADYQIGAVPGDQLIGRAFFVYFPGLLPSLGGPVMAPDFGRVRWIH